MGRLRSAKRLLIDLPRQLRLAYCLMYDARVPRYTKLAFAGGLAVIALPVIDLPESIPVVGELDVIALSLLAVRLFIAACPRYVVEEELNTPTSRRPRVRTVWQMDKSTIAPRLISAYPLEAKL